jgi:hypothetical protein
MQIGKHLILKYRAKPSVNADLFENDIRTVFLPHLAITRITQNIPDQDAVPPQANCSPHLTPVVIDLLSNARDESLLSHHIQPKSSKFWISPCLES